MKNNIGRMAAWPHILTSLLPVLFLVLFFSAANSALAQERLDLSAFELVFFDEFDYIGTQSDIVYQMFGDENDPDNNAKWFTGAGYEGLEGCVNFPSPDGFVCFAKKTFDNINVNNGILKLTATGDSDPDADGLYNRTCAVITSTYDLDYPSVMGDGFVTKGFNYGVFEIRAKLPMGSSDAAAFWLWEGDWQSGTVPEDYCNLPLEPPWLETACETALYNYDPLTNSYYYTHLERCNGYEVDVFETVASYEKDDDINKYKYFCSEQAMGSNDCTSCSQHIQWKRSKPNEIFHTYTFVWAPEIMRFFIDGNEVKNVEKHSPKFKMRPILSMVTALEGNSQAFEIDYFRVYRPKYSDYLVHYDQTNGQNLAQFTGTVGTIWDSYNGSSSDVWKREDYENTFAASDAGNKEIFKNLTTNLLSTATDGLLGVYTDANNKLTLTYSHGAGLKRALFEQNYQSGNSTQMTDLGVVLDFTYLKEFVVDPSNGDTYYYDIIQNKFKVLNQSGANSIMPISVLTPYDANDEPVNLLFVPANTYHNKRLYYINNGTDRLVYFEWVPWNGNWRRQETSVTGVVEISASLNPAGKLYYKNVDNQFCSTWIYWDYEFNYLTDDYPQWESCVLSDENGVTPADCSGGIAISPNGEEIAYRTIDNKMRIWSWLGEGLGFENRPTLVEDVVGDIKWTSLEDGRDQFIYFATHDRLKTYYQRLAPTINNELQWEVATLDIFNHENANGDIDPNKIYRNEFVLSSILDPNFIFSFYKKEGAANIEPYGITCHKSKQGVEFIPLAYNLCSTDGSVVTQNNFQGLVQNSNISQVATETQIDKMKVVCYPNPANETVVVDVEGFTKDVPLNFVVTDLTGVILYQQNNTFSQIEINLANFQSGMYLLRVSESKKSGYAYFLKL